MTGSGLPRRRSARRLAMASALACAGFAVPATTHIAAADPLAAPAAQPAPAAPVAQPAPAATPFGILQLDLCRAGAAGCSSDETAVDASIAAIHQRTPKLVTLNEVCAHDITRMSGETGYHAEFTPAVQAAGGPAPCADGRGDYGIAVLAHPDLGAVSSGITERVFTAQDGSDQRKVMLCAPFSGLAACTSQLSEADPAIAAKQCDELTGAASALSKPTVLGGDLRLRRGGDPDVTDCVPSGWWQTGDGATQHVLGTADYGLRGTEQLPVAGTDRSGLLVTLDH